MSEEAEPMHNRRSVLRAGLAAAGAALLLPKAHGCEFFSTTLRIVHPCSRKAAR